MKLPMSLFEALPLALQNIFQESRPSDRVVEYYFRQNKKWGSRDRRFFAETLFEMVRYYRSYWVRCGFPRELYTNPDALTVERCQKMFGLYFQDRKTTVQFPSAWETSEKATCETFAEKESYSDFLDQLGRRELKGEWESVARAMNQIAPVYLRVNTLKANREEVQNQLRNEGIETEVVENLPHALKLRERKNVFITKCYLKGGFEVQDLSSQQVAPLLNPQPGERVVDACAGAGGKTLHLAALMKNKGKIVALDIHQRKLDELRKRANRAGAMLIETKVLDSNKLVKRLAKTADALLLDVPCSGSGVIRRNPDTKWKFNANDWGRLLFTQKEILECYSLIGKPGARMVYATCSVFPSENDMQIESFLSQHPEWKLEFKNTILPNAEMGDGFFMALLHHVAT